ncbi:MAG: hypothetical protein Q4B87_01035 [Candidatus Saccharibacteria bacterium]|nr:hypothetical protein [Candidatus Saccharibacteria bacterium]
MREELSTEEKRKRIILIGIGVLLAIGLIILVVVLLIGRTEEEKYEPEVDKYSGDIIWNLDEEPELETGLNSIGFYRLIDFGMTRVQYQIIIDAINKYITENYNDIQQISFWTETYHGFEEPGLFTFKFVSGDDRVFVVDLDTRLTLDDVDVIIKPEA